MPATPRDRSGASLGKSKNFDCEILLVRFGPHLPFLALGGAEVAHEPEIFTEFIPNNCFSSPRQAGNRSGGHRVVQGSSPDGPCHNNHCPTTNLQNHEKPSKITKNFPKRDLKFCPASKIQFWPVKCLCASPMTTNPPQTIQGATTGPTVASRKWCTHSISVRKKYFFSKIPKCP